MSLFFRTGLFHLCNEISQKTICTSFFASFWPTVLPADVVRYGLSAQGSLAQPAARADLRLSFVYERFMLRLES
jgi:hypothetical protein